ncbi:MAG: hypothetical protein OSJ74_09410, partial [Clostridia bacterium]|nr:hypothetical protein [Clostridia bacterium]
NKKVASFEEALQRILFYNQILWQTNHNLNGLGRLDYILHNYYVNDKSKGIINKLENKSLPQDIHYSLIKGLRIEARQKLDKIKPLNLGQASRISGVSPADITVLLVYLSKNNK